MLVLQSKDMQYIKGGTTSYATILNTLLKTINTVFGLGQALGSAIARSRSSNKCSA